MNVPGMMNTASARRLDPPPAFEGLTHRPHVVGSDYFCERRLYNKADRQKSYALRYRVYCEEAAFLPASDYPERYERDLYDDRSLHFGSFNEDDEIVGTVRLIAGTIDDLPIAKYCALTPSHHQFLRGISGLHEISRLAVSRQYRRRRGDGLYGLSDESDSGAGSAANLNTRRFTYPTVLRLYRSIYHTLKSDGIEHLVASMESSLWRILRSLKFPFQEIGPISDYYGPVRPYYINISELDECISRERPEILAYFKSGSR